MMDEMVMVVVAASTDRDTFWNIVSFNKTEVISHRHTASSAQQVTCPMKAVDERNAIDQANGYVNAKTKDYVKERCEMDSSIKECSCGQECLINGVVNHNKTGKPKLKKAFHIETEGLFFAAYIRELQKSLIYRLTVLQHWTYICQRKHLKTRSTDNIVSVTIQVKVQDTLPHVLDYVWGARICRCVQERQHLDTMMSWLSTLGGACSALGDQMAGFAERAWAISVQQMEICLRLGDPNMVSRCRLYAAISLIQQCKFKVAARLIKREYLWVHTFPPEVRDTRLVNMCHGIWTKLRHERKIYCLKHSCLTTRTI
ncbi:hypothetical protein GWK47_012650 [Chionoecetes opilio]|uniref:Uncharacterized protein n=1 Tax=Chionoecetes opilio TaxID=41210 RepID=A0A8J4XVZ5_CHIOP|nr:hypothetical protein GWK47_012650 [Chionoecetes opilio]